MTFFIIFSSFSRSMVRSLEHPSHSMRTSLPHLTTVKLSEPHGCFFFKYILSFTSNLMIDTSITYALIYLEIGIYGEAFLAYDLDLIGTFDWLVELESYKIIRGVSLADRIIF